VTLSAKVVDLVRLHGGEHTLERRRVVQITVVKPQSLIRLVRVRVDVLDARGAERARSPDDAVDFVTLREQEFGEV